MNKFNADSLFTAIEQTPREDLMKLDRIYAELLTDNRERLQMACAGDNPKIQPQWVADCLYGGRYNLISTHCTSKTVQRLLREYILSLEKKKIIGDLLNLKLKYIGR